MYPPASSIAMYIGAPKVEPFHWLVTIFWSVCTLFTIIS